MKTILFFLAMCLGILSPVFAQNDYHDVSDDATGDMSLFATVGSRPFGLTDSELYFRYVDESPSADNMESTIHLRETNHSVGVKLGYQRMLVNGITIKAMLDLFGGQVGGGSLDFGAGYTIGRKKFHIRPMAILSIGGYGLRLGHLEQNSVYIEVNKTQFYSEEVYVKLRATQYAFSPQVEFGYEFTKRFELLVCGGYSLAASAKPSIRFTGYDEEESSINARESIDAPNVALLYEGEKLTRAPVKMGGFFLHAGFGFRFPQ